MKKIKKKTRVYEYRYVANNSRGVQHDYFGCQLDELYDFPGDHQPDATML